MTSSLLFAEGKDCATLTVQTSNQKVPCGFLRSSLTTCQLQLDQTLPLSTKGVACETNQLCVRVALAATYN